MLLELQRLNRPTFTEFARRVKVIHLVVESAGGFGSRALITSYFPAVEKSVLLRKEKGRGTINPESFLDLFEPLSKCRF